MIQFLMKREWEANLLAMRLAGIITGNMIGSFIPDIELDGKWVLDSGNNWFLRKMDDGSWSLGYRYADVFPADFWSSLRTVIDSLLNR